MASVPVAVAREMSAFTPSIWVNLRQGLRLAGRGWSGGQGRERRKHIVEGREVGTGAAWVAEQGLRLANFFINQGTLATLEGQKYPLKTFTADPAKALTTAPLAVLVNRGTYGAAELTAAAIEGAKRGDVVGERTFGEGSVQHTFNLPDGAALFLTGAKYQSPDGKKIQDEAVTPTVAVTSPQDAIDAGIAPQNGDEMLDKALNLLKAKGA